MDSGSIMLSLNHISGNLAVNTAGLRIKELEQQQNSLLKSVICGFNQLLDLRDLGTGVHSTRLAEWAIRVAPNWVCRKRTCIKWKWPPCCTTSERSGSPTRY